MGRARTGVGIESRVLDAVGRVGEAASSGLDWRSTICDAARELTHARMGVVGEVRGWNRAGLARPERVTDTGLDAPAKRIFLSYLSDAKSHDPFLQALVASPRVPWTYRRRSLVEDGSWYTTSYVQEYRRPAGVDDMMLAVLAPRGVDRALTVGVHRAWADGPFRPDDVRALELFQLALQGWARMLMPPTERDLPELPRRLREVLACLTAGLSEKQVAQRLGVSPHTVHMHVRRLHRTLGIANRAELVRMGCLYPWLIGDAGAL